MMGKRAPCASCRLGLIGPSWWLTSVHAGYELWSGGHGLSITWFNART